MACPWCGEESICKNGRDRRGAQVYRCRTCTRTSTERTRTPFSGYQFPTAIIALGVKWSLRYRLSYADTAEWLAERGVQVDPATIYPWVQRFTPLYQEVARPYQRPVGGIWSVDETVIHVAGVVQYAYRAIDEYGQVVDVYVSPTRAAAAARAFFARAIEETDERPERVTTDKAACYALALRTVLPEAEHVTGKMIQQRIERDHQHLKGRLRPMRGCKSGRSGHVVWRGHAFLRNLCGGHYDVGERAPTRPERLSVAWAELTVLLAA